MSTRIWFGVVLFSLSIISSSDFSESSSMLGFSSNVSLDLIEGRVLIKLLNLSTIVFIDSSFILCIIESLNFIAGRDSSSYALM